MDWEAAAIKSSPYLNNILKLMWRLKKPIYLEREWPSKNRSINQITEQRADVDDIR